MRVLYVSTLDYGANPAVDAIAHGLENSLHQAGISMHVMSADFRTRGWQEKQGAAVDAGISARVDGMVLYVNDADAPAAAVQRARSAGIPVFSFERPHYDVEGSVVYANFNHGVFMTEYLASLLPPGARVAVIGGPPVVDDIELLHGLVHGVQRAGLTLVNDPFDTRYRNLIDVADGGRLAARNVLADFPQLDGLVPFNDETLLGTLEALRETGRLSEMKMVSRNGTPAAVQAVAEGLTDGTWDLDCPGIGAAVGELALRQLVGGETLRGELKLAPIGRMVTAAEAAAWVPWSDRVTYRPLTFGLD